MRKLLWLVCLGLVVSIVSQARGETQTPTYEVRSAEHNAEWLQSHGFTALHRVPGRTDWVCFGIVQNEICIPTGTAGPPSQSSAPLVASMLPPRPLAPRIIHAEGGTYGRGAEVPLATLKALLMGPDSGWGAQMAGTRMGFVKDALRTTGLTAKNIGEFADFLGTVDSNGFNSIDAKKFLSIDPATGATRPLGKLPEGSTIVYLTRGTEHIPFWVPELGALVVGRDRIVPFR
jgi:hypothetical protein